MKSINLYLFNEITQDITNFFKLMDGENGDIDLISIDNLRQVIKNKPDNFSYTINEFDTVITSIFK